MIKIDQSLLQEIGLGALPEADKHPLLNHIYETLEMRVGMRLADQMSNQQLDEFEQYFDAKDDAGAFRWLESMSERHRNRPGRSPPEWRSGPPLPPWESAQIFVDTSYYTIVVSGYL